MAVATEALHLTWFLRGPSGCAWAWAWRSSELCRQTFSKFQGARGVSQEGRNCCDSLPQLNLVVMPIQPSGIKHCNHS